MKSHKEAKLVRSEKRSDGRVVKPLFAILSAVIEVRPSNVSPSRDVSPMSFMKLTVFESENGSKNNECSTTAISIRIERRKNALLGSKLSASSNFFVSSCCRVPYGPNKLTLPFRSSTLSVCFRFSWKNYPLKMQQSAGYTLFFSLMPKFQFPITIYTINLETQVNFGHLQSKPGNLANSIILNTRVLYNMCLKSPVTYYWLCCIIPY